jgi:predicted helicase
MTTIDDVLETIRSSSENSKEVGDKFERLMLAFFRTDPAYKRQFSEVWMWGDWPDNKGGQEIGIDLVAENVDGEGFTAIQCKCYAPTTPLTKGDIDSFFTESGKAPFTHRIIVCTTNLWSPHAQSALTGQDKPVRRIGVEDLDSSTIDWDQWDLNDLETLRRHPRKKQRPHQTEAIEATLEGFKDHDRGKLIMACGTGKTYTAQRIAEQLVGPGGTVLVLMPSISLLSQTLKEWTADASIPIAPYAVCSDTKAGKKRYSEDMSPYDLVLPATTDPDLLVAQFNRAKGPDTMSVFFSTYQSIGVLSTAQQAGIPDFDLVVADEAHRTTGVTLAGEDDSTFTKVHDDVHLKAVNRLYMTATPRVFSDAAKGKARSADAWLASMDDVATFGPEFHRLGFHQAVKRNLLTDYKVIVLAVDEKAVSAAFQQQLSDDDHELKLDDATRIVGCVNALAKRNVHGETFGSDDLPMQRAVAFSNTIAHSKKFTGLFGEIANQWNSSTDHNDPFHVEVDHVDGKFNSMQREDLLHWLKEDPGETGCHVLSNAKCLTEGVDVPDLDAILFLEPRNSMVDVIQAVGRVMRKVDGKNYGYVVLPVGIPADETPEQALSDNKRFKAVWQVLNALRSHDERMNAVINKLDLNDEPPDMIEVIPVGFDEDDSDPETGDEAEKPRQLPLPYPLNEIRDGIYAKLVLKVGTRHYWEDWASDVAEIASKHETRIKALINDPDLGLSVEFDHFVDGLHTIINDSITRDGAVAMLSQHLITKPVFDALFTGYDFSANNPVSKVMQAMIDRLDDHSLDKETESLEGFYDSVRLRVEGIDNAAGKQRIITELYEGFFSKAFPKAAESLGIVYTPVELVDFVLHAADHALRKHFDGTSLSDEGVNILDPFCGTGTFLVRLLQSGIIKPEDLTRKYAKELHSNELLLLAYYIAAINIESTYHDITEQTEDNTDYEPFDGIVLTDTFQLGETGEGSGTIDVFPINNERATNQKGLGIRVIIGNPPYSAGQTNQNDNNQNLSYERLDQSISKTYVAGSRATNNRQLHDSYVRAFRWSSNRVANSEAGGILAFVTNGGFIDNNSFDGFRKSIASEFHHIYCYNLRGNSGVFGEVALQEGGNVFDVRVGIAITIFVKEPGPVPKSGAQIHYGKLPDYLSKEEKLEIIHEAAIPDALDQVDWTPIIPNAHGDWINQRSDRFNTFTPLTPNNHEDEISIFIHRSLGLATGRDAWNYNSSKAKVTENARRMVAFFNEQNDAFHFNNPSLNGTVAEKAVKVKASVEYDSKMFSWTSGDYSRLANREKYEIDRPDQIFRISNYRPFVAQHLNFHPRLNARTYQLPRMFPDVDFKNLAICLPPPGSKAPPFSVLIVNKVSDMGLFWGGTQMYPLVTKVKTSRENQSETLFTGSGNESNDQVTNISDQAISTYRLIDPRIGGIDLFYYVYGILHSPHYRSSFASDLKKELPRIPLPTSGEQFWVFSQAGRDLADLHLEYEEVEPWPDLEIKYKPGFDSNTPDAFRVEKIRYMKNDNETDLSTVIYNSNITISGIPISAHEYRIGSRSAIDWIIDRYQIRTHKNSGIVNDPNQWADEHDDPTYIFDLLRRIVTVSMKTNEIVANLPKLEF